MEETALQGEPNMEETYNVNILLQGEPNMEEMCNINTPLMLEHEDP